MNKSNILSKKQTEILTFIKKFLVKNGKSPSVREIADGVSLHSPATVHVHLQNLIAMGYLKRKGLHSKDLELLVPNEFDLHEDAAIGVALIDLRFIDDIQHELSHPNDFFYLSSQMIPRGSEVFVLVIPDDSLVNLGFHKEDYVIVEKNKKIFSNENIVCLYQDEVLIREVVVSNKNIILSSHSKKIPTIRFKQDDIIILGKVVGLYREF